MFRRRFFRFLLALAVLLNVAGGPIAFAHAVSPGHSSSAAASEVVGSEHCDGHAEPSQPDAPVPSDHTGQDCCASGHCACVAASTFHTTSAPALTQFARYLRANELPLGEPPSAAPNDPLRPPIV